MSSLAKHAMQHAMHIADAAGRQRAAGSAAFTRQLRIKLLQMRSSQLLDAHATDVRHDIALEQLRITLARLRAKVQTQPVSFPTRDELAQCLLRRIDTAAASIRRDQAGKLDLGLALGSFERRITDAAPASLIAVKIVFQFPATLAATSDVSAHSSSLARPILLAMAVIAFRTRSTGPLIVSCSRISAGNCSTSASLARTSSSCRFSSWSTSAKRIQTSSKSEATLSIVRCASRSKLSFSRFDIQAHAAFLGCLLKAAMKVVADSQTRLDNVRGLSRHLDDLTPVTIGHKVTRTK
jgi:hypothetical protein